MLNTNIQIYHDYAMIFAYEYIYTSLMTFTLPKHLFLRTIPS